MHKVLDENSETTDRITPHDICMRGIDNFTNEELVEYFEGHITRNDYRYVNKEVIEELERRLEVKGPKKKWWEGKFKERFNNIKEVM